MVLELHQFIHSQQTAYYYSTKESLAPGEVLVVGDFSEHYSFIYQDAVQGVHWTNTSCTLHPWVCYFVGQDGALQTYTSLIISDYLSHNTVAVYAFQNNLINQLKIKLMQEGIELMKIKYHTNGCAGQYKNKKNCINLIHHKKDFGIEAYWSFSATGHGKGPWDGLAGSAKREAALESLRRPSNNQIQTATDFYKFVQEKIKKVKVEFVGEEEIKKIENDILIDRFKSAKTIKGTRSFHSFETIVENENITDLNVRKFSFSMDVKRVKVLREKCYGGQKQGKGKRTG